jgi:hypothetical protein
METQDAHEDILVIAQVSHSLDILNMGMLPKQTVDTSTYKFVQVHTRTYCNGHTSGA